jgi:hypothetical protein
MHTHFQNLQRLFCCRFSQHPMCKKEFLFAVAAGNKRNLECCGAGVRSCGDAVPATTASVQYMDS